MGFSTISPRLWKGLKGRQNYLIVDLREPEEYQEGHLPNAVNIPYEDWEDRRSEVEPYPNILFYCDRGNISLLVAREFEYSQKNVLTLNGGYPKNGEWL